MIFLVRLTFGYRDEYFKFEYIDNLEEFTRWVKCLIVPELSDDPVRVTIEILSKDEYNKKIEEEKGE